MRSIVRNLLRFCTLTACNIPLLIHFIIIKTTIAILALTMVEEIPLPRKSRTANENNPFANILLIQRIASCRI
jgi:hypothetical protein